MPLEHGGAVNLMATVKQTINLNGVTNPGKLLPQGLAVLDNGS
jgi:hypothetical protein